MKKNLKKLAALLLAVLLAGHAFTAAAAIVFEMSEETGGGDAELRAALSIENEYGPYLLVGNSLTLSVPAGYTDVKWSSADTNIATVSDGVVTGVSAGRVKITARDNSSSEEQLASTFVTVVDPEHTYTVTYEIDYPGDAYIQTESNQKKTPIRLTLTEKTNPVTGESAYHYLKIGDYDTTNYRMTGWKLKGGNETLEQGSQVEISGDVTYVAQFELIANDIKSESLKVNYLSNVDGKNYYSGAEAHRAFPNDDYKWRKWNTEATIASGTDGKKYAAFSIVNSKRATNSVEGYGLNDKDGPERTFIGVKLLAIWTGQDFLDISQYENTVFAPGEEVKLPYPGRNDGYFFRPVFSESQTTDAEVRVVVGYKDRNNKGEGFYIGQGHVTEMGRQAIMEAAWDEVSNVRNDDSKERHIYGKDENGKDSYFYPVNPDYYEISKCMNMNNILKRVGLSGQDPENYEVIWSKVALTQRGFLVEGILQEKTEKTEKTDMVILINGDEIRKTYDRQATEVTYAASSSAEGFDESKVLFDGQHYSRTDCGTTVSKWSQKDFEYADETVNAKFVVNNGYVRITPVQVTLTAVDQVKYQDSEDPKLTVEATGLLAGDTIDDLEYTVERVDSDSEEPGEYVIEVSGEKTQGNYKINFVDGKMTIKIKLAVGITSNLDGMGPVPSGTEVTLVAHPVGFTEDCTYQWWYSETGLEEDMQPVDGANKDTYTFILTSENASWIWRVAVQQ